MNTGRMQDSRSESIDAQHGGNVNKTVIEISERTLSVVAFGLAVAGFVIALWANRSAQTAANELKQVQVQLMYSNAIMLREGIVEPGDMVYGPEGNLEYKQHELKKPKEK